MLASLERNADVPRCIRERGRRDPTGISLGKTGGAEDGAGRGRNPGRRQRSRAAVAAADRKYIISRVDGRQVGLIVDAVAEVRRIADAAVAPPPPLALASGACPFFSGVVHWDDDIVLVVDLDQVLDEAERRDLAALGDDGAPR